MQGLLQDRGCAGQKRVTECRFHSQNTNNTGNDEYVDWIDLGVPQWTPLSKQQVIHYNFNQVNSLIYYFLK